jgi:RHS repeat-associated protein
LGTPIQATDRSGIIVWSAQYNAFGRANITTPTATDDKPVIASSLRFPGQVEDAETGLYYNWHRYYDPEVGRYVTADPIGLVGGVNFYAYVNGNPVNFTDLLGLARDCDQEHIECFRQCWNQNPPWPIKRGDKGHYKYCSSKCLAEYMACNAENAAESACKGVADYCSKNPAICIGIGVGGGLIIGHPEIGILF